MRNLSRIATCTIERTARFGKTRTSHNRSRTHSTETQKGAIATMRRRIWILLFLSATLWGKPAAAQGLGGFLSNLGQVISTLAGNPSQGVIVRTTLGAAGLQ